MGKTPKTFKEWWSSGGGSCEDAFLAGQASKSDTDYKYKFDRAVLEIKKLHTIAGNGRPLPCSCVFCTGITECNDCGGTGTPEGCPEPKPECPYCGGTGKVTW